MRFILWAVACGLGLPSFVLAQTDKPAVDPTRLAIGRTQGPLGGTLRSEHLQKDGSTVLHGLQVSYGPGLQIKEYSVFNLGRCEQLVQFYANGNEFRVQWRDHEGNGSEVIYAPLAEKVVAEKVIVDAGVNIGPIKTQETVCVGRVKGGKCWEGSFLVRELHGFQFDWMLQEFKDGKRISSKPFPLDKLGLAEEDTKDEKWRWSIPDWPKQ